MCLPFVYLTSLHVTKSPRPSPSSIWSLAVYILQAIKYWRWKWTGNEARLSKLSSSFAKPFDALELLYTCTFTLSDNNVAQKPIIYDVNLYRGMSLKGNSSGNPSRWSQKWVKNLLLSTLGSWWSFHPSRAGALHGWPHSRHSSWDTTVTWREGNVIVQLSQSQQL